MANKSGTTVSLVLGSGGARGMAHIGVIERLREDGYDIRCIAGASMGALVGGIYATGALPVFRDWLLALHKTDVLRYLDFSFSTTALFRGEKIIDALRDLVGCHQIEDLPLAYTAVATNVERQREVWLEEGPLFEAIRASIAVPTIFTPYEYRGMRLLDGGLLNPVPIAPTLKTLTDLTIAVNLNAADNDRKSAPSEMSSAGSGENGRLKGYQASIQHFLDDLQEDLQSLGVEVGELNLPFSVDTSRAEQGLFDLLNDAFATMQNAIANIKLAAYPPDVLIEIPRASCRLHEFHRAREMIDLGYEHAGRALGR